MTQTGNKIVAVRAPGTVAVGALFAALRTAGLEIAESGELQIVVARDLLEPGLSDVADEAGQERRPWLLVAGAGELASVGPLFVPGRGVCWHCLASRARANDCRAAGVQPAAQAEAAFRLAAREAATWLRTGHAGTEKRWTTIDKQGRTRQHPVIAACAECKAAAARVRLSRPDLESEITGLVASHAVSEVAPALFRAEAVCSQAWFPDYAGRFLRAPRQRVDGKGSTATEALRHCLGEAVERYSLLCQGTERRQRAAYQGVRERAIAPDECLLASPRQHARAQWWRRRHGSFHWVSEPFDETCAIDWVEAFDATTGEAVLIPASYCLLGYGSRFAQADSNGCAAGATVWHAARGALLELIERDSVAIWWYNRLRRPPVDWRACDRGRLGELARWLRRRGRRFWLLDLSSDLEVPVYVAVSHDGQGARIALGSGASTDPATAAWKAISEMVVHSLDFGENPGPRPADRNLRAWWKWWHEARVLDHPYLVPRGLAVLPRLGRPLGAQGEFRHCVRQVEAAGIRVLLYDHTRPELKIPVIRAIAPGLRHFWARFGPGRLYDVPVRLGWRDAPSAETELNPIPYFL